MRIVLLTSKLNFETAGGSVMDLHLKAKGLADLGHEVTVITAFSRRNIITGTLPYTLIEENIPNDGMMGIQHNVYHILKKNAPEADVFYIDGQIFIYGGGLFRLLGGRIPVVPFFNIRLSSMGATSGNIDPNDLTPWKRAKMRLRLLAERTIGTCIANKNDLFIFNTPHVQEIYRKFGYDTTRSVIIEDFVDMRLIVDTHRITPDHIRQNQKNKEHITLFATGRILKEKGFDIIVRAFALLSDKERYRVIISGGGPDKERIEGIVKEQGLGNYFTFPGWVDKETLTGYFLTAQIFIFPKWWIEYGSALLTEAIAFGLPAIIPGGGALEWLTQGNALTFHNDNAKELAMRIEELGQSEALRIELGNKGLARVATLDQRVLTMRLEEALKQTTAVG